jgi:ABC-type transporter Mla maintaining outer membrane lipid asymmetry ATPase subunit MlaF
VSGFSRTKEGPLSEAVISVGLVKNYRAGMRRSIVQAVRGLSLTVPRGAIVAFVGPNGAGVPAGLPASVRERPTVDYGEQRTQTAKTAGYAGAYFLIGCVLFTRRDLKFT